MDQKIIIISYTDRGSKQNAELGRILTEKGYLCRCFAVERFAAAHGLECIPEDAGQWIGTLWGQCAFLFIGASGIAVRMIAPWVRDKFSDSAVLVMDEAGRYVIPLLSGHMGGAVEIATDISDSLGAVPVITTATDVAGKFAVDVFAKKNHLLITDRIAAKQISAAVLEGKDVGFFSSCPVEGRLPEGLVWCEAVEELSRYVCGVAVHSGHMAGNMTSTVLQLIPKTLIVGIGCRKNVPFQHLKEELESLFRQQRLDVREIAAIVSIDLKKDEQGLKELAAFYRVPFVVYPADRLKEAGEVTSSSAFVENVTGVDNVCERAAWAFCEQADCGTDKEGAVLLLPKQKLNRMTAAVVKTCLHISCE